MLACQRSEAGSSEDTHTSAAEYEDVKVNRQSRRFRPHADADRRTQRSHGLLQVQPVGQCWRGRTPYKLSGQLILSKFTISFPMSSQTN